MYLKQDHTYSCVDLFKTFNVDNLKGNGKIARKYKCRDKRALAQKIFLRYLYLMLEDLTNGKHIFYFSSKRLSCIRMVRVSGDNFKELRKKGMFKDVDFLMSNFSGYLLTMDYHWIGGKKVTKYVAVSKQFRDKITNMTNAGFRYC
jgi:hypothetical protein